MDKSARLASWLDRRERAGAMVPHHFIRRGEYDWDDPVKLDQLRVGAGRPAVRRQADQPAGTGCQEPRYLGELAMSE
jgi:hypothetical protein